MTNATEYVQAIQEKLHQKDQGQEEFLQAIDEFMPTVFWTLIPNISKRIS